MFDKLDVGDESMVRTLFYHEVSHGILTIVYCYKTSIRHI